MTRRGFNETNVRGNFHVQVVVGTRKVNRYYSCSLSQAKARATILLRSVGGDKAYLRDHETRTMWTRTSNTNWTREIWYG